jgi:broad specificity phosphatase PhoE
MAFLYLVRHGQAGDRVLTGSAAESHAIERNYDVLSERGHLQAAATADSLARRQAPGSTVPVISGPLNRQRDTAGHIADALQSAAPTVDENWREFNTDAVVSPWLAQNPATVASMQDATAEAGRSDDGRRALGALTGSLLEDAMGWWVTRPEFDEFRSTVLRAVASASETARGSGSTVVVTSAGVIALCAVESFGLGLDHWPSLAGRILTASVSLFRVSGADSGVDGLDVLSFNEHAHLDEPDAAGHRPLRRFS